MKAMVLAAGLGERLHPLTTDRSKTAVSVLNRPLVLRSLQYLASRNINEVVINRHRHPESIALALLGQTPPDMVLHFSDEPEILGTAGGVLKAAGHLRDGTFVVMNSDFISDIDLDAVLEAHRRSGRLGTLVLTPPGKHFFGAVRREPKSGRILGIQSAPTPARDFSTVRRPPAPAPRPVAMDETGPFEFCGLQILEPAVLERIPAGRRSDLVRDVYAGLVQDGKLGGYVHEGFWWEFGTPERFLLGHAEALGKGAEGLARLLPLDTIPAGSLKGPNLMVGPGYFEGAGFRALVDPTAMVSADVVLDGAVVIGPRCRVGSGVRLTDSVLLDGSSIGDGSDLDRVVMGHGVQAPAQTRLFRCAIGKGDAAIKVAGSSQRSWQGYILRPLSN